MTARDKTTGSRPGGECLPQGGHRRVERLRKGTSSGQKKPKTLPFLYRFFTGFPILRFPELEPDQWWRAVLSPFEAVDCRHLDQVQPNEESDRSRRR